MRKNTENWLVFIFVSVVSIAGLIVILGNSSITGAAYNPICGPVYSEVSGKYYTACSADPWITNPTFRPSGERNLIQPSSVQVLRQFPIENWQQRYYPAQKMDYYKQAPQHQPVYYQGVPYYISYKDTKIGTFDREKWLERHS